LEGPAHEIMEVNDISKRTHRYIDHTNRVTDLLDPKYQMNGMLVTDDPRYTKPKKNPAFIPENKLLQTSDIEGAQPGWIPPARFNPPLEKRREFRNTNYIDDIEGTKAGTVKHSIVTTRVTDPLNPVYHSLDPGEILPNPLEPLVPATYYQRTRNGTEITQAHTSTAESFSRPTVYQEPALSEPKGSLASNKRDDYAKEREGARRQAGPEYDPSEDHKAGGGGRVGYADAPTRGTSPSGGAASSRDPTSSARFSSLQEAGNGRGDSLQQLVKERSSSLKEYEAKSYADKFTNDDELIRGGDGLSLERAGGDVLTEAEKLHAYLHSKPKAHLDTKQKAAITTFSGKRAEV